MAHPRLKIPAGNGELATQPALSEWQQLARDAQRGVAEWDTEIGGVPIRALRERARTCSLELAREYTAALGLPTTRAPGEFVVATGHQPELFHPGIWAKYFLLQRLADELGAEALDLVVDSDGFDAVAFAAPCMGPEVGVCRDYLALGSKETCYSCAPPPDDVSLKTFAQAGRDALASLPAPAVAHHFETFCGCLEDAVGHVRQTSSVTDLGSALTLARRTYEAPAGTDYLELSVTRMARSEAYLRLVAHVALDAARFASDFNDELGLYRKATRTRSMAQPFPDLAVEGGGVELPLWAIDKTRRRVEAYEQGESVRLVAEGETIIELPRAYDEAVEALVRCSVVFAPRAIMLTLYVRMLVADLFIHGVGGARYDVLTDGLARRYFGVELPSFAAASLTMLLPLGVSTVGDEDVADAQERLNRLAHHPDAFLGDVEFDSPEERDRALALVARKGELVDAIAAPDADKKAIGAEIRQVNEAIGALLAPVAKELAEDLSRVEQERAASAVLADRSYPFCLWSPLEVQDKVT